MDRKKDNDKKELSKEETPKKILNRRNSSSMSYKLKNLFALLKQNKNKLALPVKIYILLLIIPVYILILHALGNISHLYNLSPSGYKTLLTMVWAIFIIGINIGIVTFLLALFNDDPWMCIISSLGTVFLISAFIHFKSNISNYFVSVPVIQLFWSIFFFLIILAKIIHHPILLNNYFENFIKKYNYFLDYTKKYKISLFFFVIGLIFPSLYYLQYFPNQMDQGMLTFLTCFFFSIAFIIGFSKKFNFKFKKEILIIFLVPIAISLLLLRFQIANLMESPFLSNFDLESSIFFSFSEYLIPFIGNLTIFLFGCIFGILIFWILAECPEIIEYLVLPFFYLIARGWNFLQLNNSHEKIEFHTNYLKNLNPTNLNLYLHHSFELLIPIAMILITTFNEPTIFRVLFDTTYSSNDTEITFIIFIVSTFLFFIIPILYSFFFILHLAGFHYKNKPITVSIFHKVISISILLIFILRLLKIYDTGLENIRTFSINLGTSSLWIFGISFG
ncbi:MAG TPA: hypothetical protein ENI51_09750, partial [Candidatus Atribacteria bacterium]|nr:hypothetical protein [Candidatus Atribacteria bacterium]